MTDDSRRETGHLNNRTVVHGRVSELLGKPRQALGARDSFLVAYEEMATLARGSPGPSVVVAAVDGHGLLVDVVLVSPRHALIIGRHSRCGLRLDEENISLRHLALLVHPEQHGLTRRMHLWDLHTSLPFRTEDERTNAAAIFEGAGCLFLGTYTLWLVPSEGVAGKGWPSDGRQAWEQRPRTEFVDGRVCAQPRAARPATQERSEQSAVTSVSALLAFESTQGEEDARGYGVLVITQGSNMERRSPSAESLERGILLGRYPRCNVAMDAHGVSRVHLMLVLIGDEVWVIDTASTNGVWAEQRPVRAQVLGRRSTLTIGKDVLLGWRRG